MQTRDWGIILLIGLLITGLFATSIPFTEEQFFDQATDINYYNYLAGDYNGQILYADWNKFGFISPSDLNVSGGGGSTYYLNPDGNIYSLGIMSSDNNRFLVDGNFVDHDVIADYFIGDGSLLTGISGGGGASTALDNLVSVAINTSLISDTDSTDDLGSTSKQWANVHTDRLVSTVSDLTIENDLSDGDIIFKVNDGGVDTELIRLDGSTSRVGIGTTEPSKSLHIVGELRVQSADYKGMMILGADAGTTTVTSNVNKQARIAAVSYPNTYTMAIFATLSDVTNDQIIIGSKAGNSAVAPTRISFCTTPTRGVSADTLERMSITSAGNVGIGKTDPSEKLDVNGNIKASGDITGNNLSGSNTGDQVGDGVTITGAGTIADPFVSAGGGGGASTALDNLASVAINLSLISDTDNTDDLGSAAKEWKDLYIDGTAYLDSIDTDKVLIRGGQGSNIFTASSMIFSYGTTALYSHYIHTRHNTGPANNAFDFYTSDGVAGGTFPTNAIHGMTITNGSVGIGTTNPLANNGLEIVGKDLTVQKNVAGSSQTFGLFNSNATGIPWTAVGKGKSADNAIALGWENANQIGGLWVWGDSLANGLYLDTTSQVFIGNSLNLKDNKKSYFGSAQDSSITYDGTNMLINPKEVGSGKLNVLGDLNVDGNVYFTMPHLFGIADTTQSPTAINTWKAIDFNFGLGNNYGFIVQDINGIVVSNPGHYFIALEVFFQDHSPSPNSSAGIRITKNGAEVSGSYSEISLAKQDADVELTTIAYVSALAGDVLQMQWITSDIDVNVQNNNTWSNQPIVAKGFINWVHPTGGH